MINAEITMQKDNKIVLTMSGSEYEIVAESMVLLKSIYEGLKDAGAKNVKDSMRLAIVYALISGNLFDEEPVSELLDSFFEAVGLDKDEAGEILTMEADEDDDFNMEILEKEDAMRKILEKAVAYGD